MRIFTISIPISEDSNIPIVYSYSIRGLNKDDALSKLKEREKHEYWTKREKIDCNITEEL